MVRLGYQLDQLSQVDIPAKPATASLNHLSYFFIFRREEQAIAEYCHIGLAAALLINTNVKLDAVLLSIYIDRHDLLFM